jgi:nucleoside-diphosphate-sugar epimerase
MRILVTGATGFVGTALVRQAMAAGHDVCALVRPSGASPGQAGLTVGRGTLADPPWEALARFRPQCCVHAAWITTPGGYAESPENDRYRDESLAFLTGLVERGVGHIVALGTSAEYRPAAAPLDEASALAPRDRYARAKHELRLGLTERMAGTAARLAWARVFQPYGAGEPAQRLCSTVVRRLAAGERVTLDNPDALRDWIHVDDVAGALLCLVESGAAAVVNVGTGVGRTVGSVACSIASILGRPDLIVTTRSASEVPGPLVADIGRLRGLGWTPRVRFEAGLTRLIEALGYRA